MQYSQSLKLHKMVTELEIGCTFEHVTLLTQIVCTRRQLTFKTLRNNGFKIGRNTTANKFYHLNDQISLNTLSLGYVHFKKLMKIQFLKYGKT